MKSGNSCFLFLGQELGEKEAALKELRKKISTKGSLEETSFYAGETAVGEMVAALRNLPLFAESRLFLIKNAENIKKKEEIDLLSSYMESPQDNTILVLISEENSINKGLEKAGVKQVFYELSDQKKSEWVGNFFRSRGYTLNNETIRTILELVENNTAALGSQCSRLLLFLDKEKEIRAAEVEKLLSHTREESAFTLFSRIAAGDFERSLESLRTLLAAKETPVSLFGGLLWCFKKLRDYLAMEDVRDDTEYRKIGIINPQALRDYAAAARLYNSAAVESCIALIAGYDLKTRSANTFPDYILMDEFLYKVMREIRN